MACVTLKRPLDFDPLHSPNHRGPPTKRTRRCLPMSPTNHSDSGVESTTSSSSVFGDPTPLTPGEIANNLRDELKRLKRRHQLVPYSRCSPEPMTEPQGQNDPPSTPSPREKPLFTLKQMTLICERMCRERTEKVREEYDKILQQKLSEQYDAFVKFIDHQIQQRFNDSHLPSYLS